MRKVIMTALVGIAALSASAQNIQIHYDLGSHLFPTNEGARQDVTLTYEGFKADKLGSWFYFIDADFNKNGMTGAYTEISREFNLAKVNDASSLAAHAEINAGLSNAAGIFQPCFLVGPAWNWHSTDFSKTFSLQLMYKQFTGQNCNISGGTDYGCGIKPYCSFQVTGVWGLNFGEGKWTFSGFCDFWRGLNSQNGHGCLVILTEPQLWYNVSKSCAFGTEVEISNNFVYRSIAPWSNDKFFVNPTVAFKYTF